MGTQLIQQKSNSKTAAGATLTVTIGAPVNGNFLVLVITSDGSNAVSSIAGGGVDWVRSVTAGTGPGFCEIWHGPNANAGGTTVTITYAASVGSAAAIFMEWSGIFSAVPEDVLFLGNNGTTSPASTASLTPIHTQDLIIAGVNSDVNPTTVTNGFTTLTQPAQPGNSADIGAAYLVVSDLAAKSTAFTVTGTTGWNTAIAAYRIPVGPPVYPQFPDRLSQARSEQAADTFNRADSGTLGANWTVVTSTSALQIVTNQVEASSVIAVCVEYYSAIAWRPDQFSEVTIIALNTSGDGPGPAVRCSATQNSYYAFQGTSFNLIKVVNGTLSIITGGPSVAVNDVIRLEVEGNILRIVKNGVVVFQTKDSDLATGSPGVFISTAGDAVTTAIVDNWKGGNLVPRPYYGQSSRPKILDPFHDVGLYR